DVEFITELCVALDTGLDSKVSTKLDKIYLEYDETFAKQKDFEKRVTEFFDMFAKEFSSLKKTKIVSLNSMHDLFIAATHLKYGIPGLEDLIDEKPIGAYFKDAKKALSGLEKLSNAIEVESDEDWVKDFALASKRSTTKKRERGVKIKFMIRALKGLIK
ncbi:MAG: hypothetical protein ABI041_02275, partial [Bdellovibrionia bacterium]